MTALAGILRFEGGETHSDLRRMLKSQDMYGQHSGDWTNGPLSMGRRLFRLLPEDRRDLGPQIGGGGSLVLVADVRLDNRDEIAAALGISPSLLVAMPDSGLLMKAFEAWGIQVIERLVGDFAIAFWDNSRGQLVLARDFLGQRPLHYHRGRDFFAFASMPKGLHALAEVPYAPNQRALTKFLALLPNTESYFKGIEKVEPGHVVVITKDALTARSYWNPPRQTLRLKDPRDYEAAVRNELDRAVQSRLRGAGDCVGTQLSAGLDSSAVTATAAMQLGPTASLVAYTSAPEGDFGRGRPHSIADEWPLAVATAQLYPNITHVRVPSSGASPLERLDFYFQIFDRPILNLCNSVWTNAILDDARSRGITVMLSGEAGNLSFSYDGMTALSQMLSERRWVSLAGTCIGLVRGGTRLGTVAAQLLGPHLPPAVWQAISALRGKGSRLSDYTLLNPDLEPVVQQWAVETGSETNRRPRSDPHESRIRALRQGDPGNSNKGYLGGWGVDFRDPTADRRLVEFCLTIPPEQFLLGGVPRSLARRAFADRLPDAVRDERRKGYQAPDWHVALDAARAEVTANLIRYAKTPEVRTLVATDRMKRLLAEWPSGGDWNSDERIEKYRLALLRGASAAHFTSRSTGSNH